MRHTDNRLKLSNGTIIQEYLHATRVYKKRESMQQQNAKIQSSGRMNVHKVLKK